MKKLPDTLYKLLKVGLRDLRKVEESEDYEVDMSTWHDSKKGGPCLVCMAGAVMGMSLKGDVQCNLYPNDFGEENHNKLLILDYLRVGEINRAIRVMGIGGTDRTISNMSVTHYELDREAFYRDMEEVLEILREERL